MDGRRTLHAKPLDESIRHDQLIPVNKAANEKEHLEKRAGGWRRKTSHTEVALVNVTLKRAFVAYIHTR
jgi:hypothetical protein